MVLQFWEKYLIWQQVVFEVIPPPIDGAFILVTLYTYPTYLEKFQLVKNLFSDFLSTTVL